MADDLVVNGGDITGGGNLTITPTTTLTLNSTGDLSLDSTTDISLDADGGDIFLRDGGATFGTLTNSTGNLTIDSQGGSILSSDALNIGGATAQGFNFFADATTGVDGTIIGSDNDLYIEDDLEVDGSVRFGNQTYTFPATSGSNNYALTTNGTGTLSWNQVALGTNYWKEVSGSLLPINQTYDLIVGGTGTVGARFAVTNVSGGVTTATLSAGTTGGAYLTADGILQTTACLLYTSDAADDLLCVDLGGRRIMKKKTKLAILITT